MTDFTEKKYPSYNQYPDTWVAHCAHLRPTTYKVLHLILQFMWINDENQCRILNDSKTLSRASYTNWPTLKRAMSEILDGEHPFLMRDGKYLFSKRLHKEREKYLAVSKRKRSNAKGKRSDSGSSTDAEREKSGSSTIPCPCPDPCPCPQDLNKPKPKEPKVTREKPEPNHEPLGTDFGGSGSKNLLSRIKRVTGDDERWMEWWADVVTKFQEDKSLYLVELVVRYAEDCADDVIRRAKGLGKLKAPGPFLLKGHGEIEGVFAQATKQLITLPDTPTQGAA